MNKIKNQESLKIIKNQRAENLDFHILDKKTIDEISKINTDSGSNKAIKISMRRFKDTISKDVKITIP